MISLTRDFAVFLTQQNHGWDRWPQKLLYGKTVVIAGIGPIAEDLAARCTASGMYIMA